MGASGSLREAFSKFLSSVPGSPIPLGRNTSFELVLSFCGGDPFREDKFTTVMIFPSLSSLMVEMICEY